MKVAAAVLTLSKTLQYALVDGTKVYRLSYQETPAQLAVGQVKVMGVLLSRSRA